MSDLPKFKKTFLFSDIEGSTRLAQKLGESYAIVLDRYRAIIHSAIAGYQGKVIDTAGDGFFAVFDEAASAIQFAVAAQRAFTAESWARGIKLKVRMGIHSGEAIATPTGYIGLEVHRASRVCNSAHGGQVLLSAATAQKVQKHLPRGVDIRELGEFMLKDFDIAETLYQLIIPGAPSEFPPPRTSLLTHTIAVLPFRNLSGDPEQDYFCEGMSEEIIIALGKIPDLQVVARSASFAFNGKSLDLHEIGQQLQATAILEGAVRKHGRQLRVTAELVDVETNINLWSGRFDRQVEDVFSVQDEIAQNIASALRVKLVSRQTRGIQNVQTNNIDAYDYYLRGRRFHAQFSRQGVEFAKQMFEKAIEEDNSYALAYCGLADCYAYLFMYVHSSGANLQAAQQLSLRAIELDPLLAEAHVSRGVALSLEGHFQESETAFERAIALDPQLFDAWYWYARVTFIQGKLEKAAHLFENANLVQPEDYQSALLAGQVYADLGLEARSHEARERGVSIAEHHLELNPGDTRALYLGANGLVALGQVEKGLSWLQRALALDPDDSMLLYNATCIYALTGQKENALDTLWRAIANGLTQRGWLENDSNLDSLRDEPRFKQLLDSI